MMQRNQAPTSAVCYVLNAAIACSLYIGNSDNTQAAEKKTYSKPPPFAALILKPAGKDIDYFYLQSMFRF
ncbi:MAG: hypothetical protein HOO92_01965 [Methylococcaceae bacterium]|nr:hypothetical protein [Methylococcaceae bacterium]